MNSNKHKVENLDNSAKCPQHHECRQQTVLVLKSTFPTVEQTYSANTERTEDEISTKSRKSLYKETAVQTVREGVASPVMGSTQCNERKSIENYKRWH